MYGIIILNFFILDEKYIDSKTGRKSMHSIYTKRNKNCHDFDKSLFYFI